MAEPGKYALSAPFERLLAEFVVEATDEALVITHRECAQVVCEVEEADGFDLLTRTVISHDC